VFIRNIPTCEGTLPPSPIPDLRDEPGVYLIEKELEQSVIVMAHATEVRLADDPSYYSATMGNSILGGGGFSSRLLSRLRTEEGFAYSASSLWTTPRRYDGLLGAITRTSPENTIPAIELILETMEGLRSAPPEAGEVQTAIERVVNGFVFNFDTPGRIVSRTMFYVAQDLPQDWLERYLNGVQRVTAGGIHDAFARHLRPDEMIILIVGDPERIGRDAIEALGPVTVLEVG
jgi:zinc protease